MEELDNKIDDEAFTKLISLNGCFILEFMCFLMLEDY